MSANPRTGVAKAMSGLAPWLAAAAFAALLVAFYASVSSYRVSLDRDARRELEARAELAAATLYEPLRTQDFATIRAFGENCRARGYELLVRTHGGRIFDTRTDQGASDDAWIFASSGSGEFVVSLLRPREEVFASFRRTYRLFVLAALVGAAGMLFLFAAFYRQRVRIRELAKLEKFRRDFIADVSHEIRTPLTGILGAAEMLDAGDGVQQRLVGMIRGEAKRLEALVQQILDLARLEREGDILTIAETDVAALVAELAAKYGVRAEGAAAQGEALWARCDAQLVSQAVSNLIENALRHSGTTDIAVSAKRVSGGVVIAVEDHGKGIPPEHAASIFERFHRVDPARAAESGGAGLGLAIVRRIARLHGGDASYAPAKPAGSRFSITLITCA